MHPETFDEPRTAEEAVVGLLIQAGRRLRTRHPDDEVEPSCFPLAKHLMTGEGMRVSDLAERVELDQSTVSRHVKMLEENGIVERAPDPDDGRASLVRLSTAGRATVRATFERRFQRIKNVLEPWSQADRADLQRLLTRLAADLGAADDHEVRSH
ncbi:MAG: MarR family winged helix-turn-helix transcriptional regulator [Nocardioidaceae bacterium]